VKVTDARMIMNLHMTLFNREVTVPFHGSRHFSGGSARLEIGRALQRCVLVNGFHDIVTRAIRVFVYAFILRFGGEVEVGLYIL